KFAALLGKAGKVEHAQAAGVFGGDVVIDIHVLGVFDFVAVHVVFGAVAAHHHVIGLPDVEPGIGRPLGDGIFDQHVLTLGGIDGVGTVLGVGAAGPLHAHAAHGDVVAAVNGETVAGCVLNSHVFDHEVVGLYQQS